MRIQAIDWKQASENHFQAWTELQNHYWQEADPSEPPKTLEMVKQQIQNNPEHIIFLAWFAWDDDGTLLGRAYLYCEQSQSNQHLAHFFFFVLPEFRRQGVARALLPQVLECAQQLGKTLLMGSTDNHVPAGAAFATRIGSEVATAGHDNRLDLQTLDRDLIRQWLEVAPEDRYELGFYQGGFPEPDAQALCELYNTIFNDMPRDDLQIEDSITTLEEMRAQERSEFAKGITRWTMTVRERKTRTLVGFTEMLTATNRTDLLHQWGTGVLQTHRGHGLGRWLKAAMIDRVRTHRPDVRWINTGNADSNAAMLRINDALGFKAHLAFQGWQVQISKVLGYLQSHA